MKHLGKYQIGHIRIFGIGLELACSGGSCEGITLKERNKFFYTWFFKQSPNIFDYVYSFKC